MITTKTKTLGIAFSVGFISLTLLSSLDIGQIVWVDKTAAAHVSTDFAGISLVVTASEQFVITSSHIIFITFLAAVVVVFGADVIKYFQRRRRKLVVAESPQKTD